MSSTATGGPCIIRPTMWLMYCPLTIASSIFSRRKGGRGWLVEHGNMYVGSVFRETWEIRHLHHVGFIKALRLFYLHCFQFGIRCFLAAGLIVILTHPD